MDIEWMKILGWTTALGSAYSGQYRFDHLLAQDQKRRQRTEAVPAHSVAARFANPFHQRLAPPLIDFVKLPTAFEQEISAVFQLVAPIGLLQTQV
jgi:hypothetical protein